MAKNATDEVYLNYHYYSAVKEKSDRTKNYVYTYGSAEDILKYANVEQSLRSKFGTVYKELFRHLHDSGLMTKFMEHACKYISYLLHKEISQTYEYDLDTYEKFYYYTEKYYKHENSRNKLCLNNMFYIDSNMFIKLKALYGLYDNYTDFLKKRNNWNYPSCDSLKALVRDYNNYMMNHQSTSIYLNGILEHFKDKLNDTIGKHKDKCTHYDFKLEPIKLFIEHKEEQPITKSPLLQPSDPTYKLGGISEKSQPSNPKFSLESLPEKSQPEVRNHRDTSKDNAETKLNELTVDPMVSEIKKIESEEETEQTVDTQKTVEGEHSTETQPVLSASNNYETLRAHVHYEPFRHLELTHTVEPTEQSDLIEESAFIPRTVLKKEEGFFSNVQNTISGFIGEVDPVPVVGVSGGMGALFLLFRYTPVGAFFRGSRRRQRVPTRFDGVYPGFFPGFQGYEDGNFGYDQFNIAYGPE